ncbi:TPA: hypothetical protein ACS7XC_003044 [Providencia alcalifaciens]
MKNLKALMLTLIASGGIAHAGTLSHTTQVSTNFQVIGKCAVTGSWTTTPLTARQYGPFDAALGTLTLSFSGCDGNTYPYFEGTTKDPNGHMVATGPGGATVSVVPDPLNDMWSRDAVTNGGLFYHQYPSSSNGTGSFSVTLTNSYPWNPQPGGYHMTLNIGTYSV